MNQMQRPKFGAATMQEQVDIGINAFAVTLLAESFAKRRDEVGEESLCVIGYGKDEKPVYIVLSSLPPFGDTTNIG